MGSEGEQHIPAPGIPVIDLSGSENEIVTHVEKASEEWGIFQVVNHGIPSELIQRLQVVGKQFFGLSEAEKKSVAKPPDSKDNLGYMTNIQKDLEGSSNVEFDYIFHNIWPQSSIDYSYWPTNPPDYRYRSNETFKINHQFLRSHQFPDLTKPSKSTINFSDLPKPSKSIIDFSDLTFDFDFREVNEEYIREVKKLSDKILGWLSKGLGLRREAFMEEGLGGESAVYAMKIINYPPCPLPEQILGLGAHTDVNGLTLIVPNEIPGLQVFKDDHWFDYEYNPSAIAILLGDSILRMSNGRYKSVIHRTIVNKEKKRMSWVVFLKSSYDTIIKPFPELIDGDENPPKFESMTFRDLKHHWINSFRVN